MKKLIAALFAAILATVGLVAFSPAPATAACPYTQCVRTTTSAQAPATVRQGKAMAIKIQVKASGNARPVGKVKIVITGPGGFRQVITRNVTGSSFKVNSRKLNKAGRYKVTVTYTPKAGSVYKASKGSDTVRVIKRRG